MRFLRASAAGLAVWLTAGSSAYADVKVAIHDGRVTIVANDASLRQILAEWARVGQAKIVNIERVSGAPMTLLLTNVPEEEALDVLLRSVSGYLLAPRAVPAANLSRFDRILVMPASAAPRVTAAPAAPAGFQVPSFAQGAPAAVVPAEAENTDDQRPTPPTPTLPPPRGPVFSTFPAPQIVNPNQALPPPQVTAPPPDPSVPQPAGTFPAGSQPSAPFGGTSRPGMVVPPPPQPGQQPIAPAARPPEGQ